jgi:pSer/pThr/pTyr-binding forkhead associated (FHA) protein
VLRLADDTEVLLDRPVVLGRRPTPSGPGDWPHLVNLSGDSTYLSRNHLRIDLDGWHVLARDLGSRGGTTLFAPGRDPERIRAHEPHLLEPGTVVDLAGAYQVTLLTTTPAAPRSAPPDVEATT